MITAKRPPAQPPSPVPHTGQTMARARARARARERERERGRERETGQERPAVWVHTWFAHTVSRVPPKAARPCDRPMCVSLVPGCNAEQPYRSRDHVVSPEEQRRRASRNRYQR
eukprot:61281-Chlamydomonas_euryale.AAC.1